MDSPSPTPTDLPARTVGPLTDNGTAWTWLLPSLAEAVALAWDRQPPALATARAMLGNLDFWLHRGCLGHIPEVADGDAPHLERGCDAQAWSATESLRVLRWLQRWPADSIHRP